ncbi:MAG: hypothetical protein SNI70_08460 [Rikenellaceae bacterium]
MNNRNLSAVYSKYSFQIFVAIILLIATAIRIYYLDKKEGLFLDEVYSVVLSEYNDFGWTKTLDPGTYSGAEIKSIILSTDPSLKDAVSDIALLWKDNRDAPHTNFYYTLLRISLVGYEYTSLGGLIVRAGILNLIIFIITFFCFLQLLKRIFKDNRIILLALFVAFINVGGVSMSVLFRPYLLQILFFVIATSMVISIYSDIKNNCYEKSWQNFIKFAIVISLLLLTGYYAFIYVSLLGVLVLYALIRYNQIRDKIPFFLIAIIVAILLDFICYPSFHKFLEDSHATSALANHGNSLLKSVLSSAWMTAAFIKYNLLNVISAIVLLVTICIALCQESKFVSLKKYIIYVILAVIFSAVILFLARYKDFRYMSPVLPILSLIIPLVFDGIKRGVIRTAAMIFICVAMSTSVLREYNIGYLYNDDNAKLIVTENVDKPVYVYYQKNYSLGFVLTSLSDEQTYVVCSSIEDLKSQVDDKDCYVFLGHTIGDKEMIPEWDSSLLQTTSAYSIYQLN